MNELATNIARLILEIIYGTLLTNKKESLKKKRKHFF